MTTPYPRLTEYELTPQEEAVFQAETATAFTDPETGAGVIAAGNGFLSGDLLRTDRNPNYDPEQPPSTANRRLRYTLTDGYNADLALEYAGNSIRRESRHLTGRLGQLALATSALEQLNHTDINKQTRTRHALENILRSETGARDPKKQAALERIELAVTLLRERHGNNSGLSMRRIMQAAAFLQERQADVERTKDVNREKLRFRQQEINADTIARESLVKLCGMYDRVADFEQRYAGVARERFFKPGNLTVNNGWYRRHQADSAHYVRLACEGFEPLYGFLMKPMSQLARTRQKEVEGVDDVRAAFVAHYGEKLVDLEQVIDSIHAIGGDYAKLSERLQEQNFKVEQTLLDGDPVAAIKLAADYRTLLRYRAFLGYKGRDRDPDDVIEEALTVWYGSLPGTEPRHDRRELPDEIKKDPFKGLNSGR